MGVIFMPYNNLQYCDEHKLVTWTPADPEYPEYGPTPNYPFVIDMTYSTANYIFGAMGIIFNWDDSCDGELDPRDILKKIDELPPLELLETFTEIQVTYGAPTVINCGISLALIKQHVNNLREACKEAIERGVTLYYA